MEARDKQRITIDTLQLALIYLLSSSNYGISRAMSTLALSDTVASKTFRSFARLPFIIFYPTFYSSWYPVRFGFGLMPGKGIKRITEKHRYSKDKGNLCREVFEAAFGNLHALVRFFAEFI